VLDTPLNNWIADPSIDLPLALSWANEPWTRRWDGLTDDVLIPQTYGENWANRFWDDISPVLQDPRYIHVGGKPALLVYRIGEIPNALEVIQEWRMRAQADGHAGVTVLAVMASRDVVPIEEDVIAAVDGIVAFPPGSQVRLESLMEVITPTVDELQGDVLSYGAAFRGEVFEAPINAKVYPCAMPGWDNTARRGIAAYSFVGANPIDFRSSVSLAKVSDVPSLFINAWNEWAEGAVLEPSRRFADGIVGVFNEVFTSHNQSKTKQHNEKKRGY
jgi:hypothetical protein